MWKEVFVESPEDGYVSSIQKFECPFETIDVHYFWWSLEEISDFILEHWKIAKQRFSDRHGVFVISTRNSSLWFTSAISGHPSHLKRQ